MTGAQRGDSEAPGPEGVAARLDELEALHAAYVAGGWDGFEASMKLGAAVPDLIAAVRAVTELAAEVAEPAMWAAVVVSEKEQGYREGYDAAMRVFASRADRALSALSGRDDHTEEGNRG